MKKNLSPILLCSLFCAGILLCAKAAFAAENIRFIREFNEGLKTPSDVATASSGDIYVVDEQQSKVFVFDPEGILKHSFGDIGLKPGQFMMPQSLALTPMEKIVVADTGNNRIQIFNKVGELLSYFGSSGSLPGLMNAPSAVVVDQFGLIFVADTGNRRVQVFSPNGVFLGFFNTEFRPTDLTLDAQRNVYVLLPEAGKIVKYSPLGKQLQEISCSVDKRNYITKAGGLAVDTRGDLYIVENTEFTIKKFDQKNNILLSFGSQGSGRGQFDSAAGIFADSTGQVFIADKKNVRIQVIKITGSMKPLVPAVTDSPPVVELEDTVPFERNLNDISYIPGRGIYTLSDKQAKVYALGNNSAVWGSEGKNPGEFKKPAAVTATLDGRILVADTGNHRVQIFNSDGTPLYQFGKVGNKPGQFSFPQGVAVNSKGRIYVADTQNNRVQVFNNDGIYLSALGDPSDNTRGSEGFAQLRLPKAVTIDSKNQVYILETENCKIQIFAEDGRYLGSLGERGSDLGQFLAPSDITVDENDNLYVADSGNYRVQIFNSRRAFLLAFGSYGMESGAFNKMTGIAASEGRIYVTDLESSAIKRFRYFREGFVRQERLYATKTAYPSENEDENDVTKYSQAQEEATKEAVAELVQLTGSSEKYLLQFLKVDSVETLNDGKIKVTVSIPKEIPPERKAPARKK